jgi:dienelactone hydrolase
MSVFSRAILLVALVQYGQGATLEAQSVAGLRPGPWPVGFTHLAAADTSRPLASGRPRPLDIGVWYPARSASATRLTYRGYFLLTPPPDDFLPPADAGRRELDGFVGFLASQGADSADINAWLDAPMLAAADAPEARRQFPLVLVAQGNGQTLHDQAPLAEYLASRGYVVASVPSAMRIAGPLADEQAVGARADEQAADLAFLLARVAGRTDIRPGRVGVVAHSFGARAALLLAMREPRIAALVSLDGGIGTAAGRASLESAPSYDSTALRAPILHFYERLDPFMAPDFGLLRSLGPAERWLEPVPAMHHHHFASLGAVSGAYPALRPALAASAETARAYASVAAATRDFLDAFLKDDTAARARLRRATPWPPLGPIEHLPRGAH